MKLIPPLKNKSIFVIYIAKQDNGIVTASGDYIGEDHTVRRMGLEALDYLHFTSKIDNVDLHVSKVISSFQTQ